MTEFCDNCPMRGTIQGEIEAVTFIPITIQRLSVLGVGPKPALSHIIDEERTYGVVVDSEVNMSKPFWNTFENPRTIFTKISECNGAELVETKVIFFKKKYSKFCPALGQLALKPGDPRYGFITSSLELKLD